MIVSARSMIVFPTDMIVSAGNMIVFPHNMTVFVRDMTVKIGGTVVAIRSPRIPSDNLDADGTFRLTNRVELSLDNPRAIRVGSLLNVPRNLRVVYLTSSVGLAEVFDLFNAYAALGYVEWTPRGGELRITPSFSR